ncbi:MAG TPA: hypothetical protein DCG49_00190, partial [Ruminococcus sp.]|nr:hypothetical protein [Ruminococcus sp.]
GTQKVTARITAKSDSAYEITLEDADGNVVDVYTIDPKTGKGTDSANRAVNLPKTGNLSPESYLLLLSGFLLTGCGCLTMHRAGIFRRKDEES